MIDTPLIHGEKPLRAREQTNNKLNPHMASTMGTQVTLMGGMCSKVLKGAQRCSRVRLPQFGKY